MRRGLFAKHEQKDLEWINQTAENLGWNSRVQSLGALRAILHQLRDNIQVVEVANLEAQVPLKEREKEKLCFPVIETLEQYMRRSLQNENLEEIIEAVLEIIASRVDEGELIKLQRIIPSSLKGFLNNALNAPAYHLTTGAP